MSDNNNPCNYTSVENADSCEENWQRFVVCLNDYMLWRKHALPKSNFEFSSVNQRADGQIVH